MCSLNCWITGRASVSFWLNSLLRPKARDVRLSLWEEVQDESEANLDQTEKVWAISSAFQRAPAQAAALVSLEALLESFLASSIST